MFMQRVFLQRVAMSLLAVLLPVAAGEAAPAELRPVVVLSGSSSGVGRANGSCGRLPTNMCRRSSWSGRKWGLAFPSIVG